MSYNNTLNERLNIHKDFTYNVLPKYYRTYELKEWSLVPHGNSLLEQQGGWREGLWLGLFFIQVEQTKSKCNTYPVCLYIGNYRVAETKIRCGDIKEAKKAALYWTRQIIEQSLDTIHSSINELNISKP